MRWLRYMRFHLETRQQHHRSDYPRKGFWGQALRASMPIRLWGALGEAR